MSLPTFVNKLARALIYRTAYNTESERISQHDDADNACLKLVPHNTGVLFFRGLQTSKRVTRNGFAFFYKQNTHTK